MKPKRYPYSGKSKTSTIEIVKAWKNIYSDFIVKSQKEQEKSEQELDKATYRVEKVDHSIQQLGSRV